jgi:hypothetical protein
VMICEPLTESRGRLEEDDVPCMRFNRILQLSPP